MNKGSQHKIIACVAAACLFLISIVYARIKISNNNVYRANEKNMEEYLTVTSVSIIFNADSVKDLAHQSALVIEGQVDEIYKEYEYNNVKFAEVLIKVKDVYKGLYKENTIRILQTKGDGEMNEVNSLLNLKKSTKVILFLEHGKSPFTDGGMCYVPLGLFQGVYVINDDDTIKSSLNTESNKINLPVIKDMKNNYYTKDKIKSLFNNI